MNRSDILAEIRRTAAGNGGKPLGHRAFESATGIRHGDWFGIFWRAWGDAVKEAGFIPNALTGRIADEDLLTAYCLLTRELGRFPAKGDIRLKKKMDPTFPNDVVFTRRFGSYPATRSAAYAFSLEHARFRDVASLLEPPALPAPHSTSTTAPDVSAGFVYLIRHGSRREYKIGKTFNPLRREGELRLQLPEKVQPVHYIETDDPAGVEAYWHSRFAAKRKEGEWFSLSADDVAAFKRWKRIS